INNFDTSIAYVSNPLNYTPIGSFYENILCQRSKPLIPNNFKILKNKNYEEYNPFDFSADKYVSNLEDVNNTDENTFIVYDVFGRLVGKFKTTNEKSDLIKSLNGGLYIIYSENNKQYSKIFISK